MSVQLVVVASLLLWHLGGFLLPEVLAQPVTLPAQPDLSIEDTHHK